MNEDPKDQGEKRPENAAPVDSAKEEKPDPNVVVPAYQYLTEGYDPDSLKKRKD